MSADFQPDQYNTARNFVMSQDASNKIGDEDHRLIINASITPNPVAVSNHFTPIIQKNRLISDFVPKPPINICKNPYITYEMASLGQ